MEYFVFEEMEMEWDEKKGGREWAGAKGNLERDRGVVMRLEM